MARGGSTRDEGSLLLGSLLRLTVVLGVTGAIGLHLVAASAAHLQADLAAGDAASAAARAYRTTSSRAAALEAAGRAARARDPLCTIVPASLVIDASGAARIRVHRSATALPTTALPAVRGWLEADADGRSGPPES